MRQPPNHYDTMKETPFDFAIGIDRSDATLDICIASLDGGFQPSFEKIGNSPEELGAWLEKARSLRPGASFAVAFEMPAPDLVAFLCPRGWLEVYALNPSVPARFRKTFNGSGAKSDLLDCEILAQLLAWHSDKLRAHRLDSAAMRKLDALSKARRGEVDRQVEQCNRLKSLLKSSFPQALALLGRDLHAPMAVGFLRRWPSLQAARAADPGEMAAFYRSSHCSRRDIVERRLAVVAEAVALTDDPAIMEVMELRISSCLDHIEACSKAIGNYDEELAKCYAVSEDKPIFSSLPGAGPVLGPRLMSAMGQDRERFASREALQRYSGVAPVTQSSGKKRIVHRRYSRPRFLMQTFVEFAGESIKWSSWASAFWRMKKAAGMTYNCAMRELAYKWQRIIYRMWKTRTKYDEELYIERLKAKGSPVCAYLDKPAKI